MDDDEIILNIIFRTVIIEDIQELFQIEDATSRQPTITNYHSYIIQIYPPLQLKTQ